MENFHYIPINRNTIAIIDTNKLELKIVDANSNKVRGLQSTDMFDYSLLKYKKDKRGLTECYSTIIATDEQLKLYWIANYNFKYKMIDISLVEHTDIKRYLKQRNLCKKYTCNKNLESLIDIRKLFDNPYDVSNYGYIKSIGFRKGNNWYLTIDEYLSQIKSSEGSNSQIDEQLKNTESTQENNESTTENKTIEQSNEISIDTKNDNTVDKKDVLHSENNSNTTIEKNQKINISDELREKEDTLRKLEEALKIREKNIATKELQLKQRETSLGNLEVQLAQKERSLEKREEGLKVSNETLDTEQKLKLSKKKEQLDKEEATLIKREKELEVRLQRLENETKRIQKIKDQNKFKLELIAREEAILSKESTIKEAMCKIEAVDAYTISEVVLDVKNIFTFEESEIKPRNKEVVFPNYTYELLLKSLSKGDIITLPKSYIQTLSHLRLKLLETLHKKGYVELAKLSFHKQAEESIICILEFIGNADYVRIYICREFDKNEITMDDILFYGDSYANMRKEVLHLRKNEDTTILET